MSRFRKVARWLPFLGVGGGGGETDRQRLVVEQAKIEPSPGGGLCLAWVGNVFEHAIGLVIRRPTAFDDYLATTIYDNFDVPIGAVVYGTGQNTNGAGHIGIYIGDGLIMDNQGAFGGPGSVVTSTWDQWLSWQTDTIQGLTGYLGWGWYGNDNLTQG